MTTGQCADLYASSHGVVVSAEEAAALLAVAENQTVEFYLALRRQFMPHYADQRPFALPARLLAREKLLALGRDRKVYLKLTKDLVRLRLIVLVRNRSVDAKGRFTPCLYMFQAPSYPPTNVVSIWTNLVRAQGVRGGM